MQAQRVICKASSESLPVCVELSLRVSSLMSVQFAAVKWKGNIKCYLVDFPPQWESGSVLSGITTPSARGSPRTSVLLIRTISVFQRHLHGSLCLRTNRTLFTFTETCLRSAHQEFRHSIHKRGLQEKGSESFGEDKEEGHSIS